MKQLKRLYVLAQLPRTPLFMKISMYVPFVVILKTEVLSQEQSIASSGMMTEAATTLVV
jgi:hypothetical protein